MNSDQNTKKNLLHALIWVTKVNLVASYTFPTIDEERKVCGDDRILLMAL